MAPLQKSLRCLALALLAPNVVTAAEGDNSSDNVSDGNHTGPRRPHKDIFKRPQVNVHKVNGKPRPSFTIVPAGGDGGDKTWTTLTFEGVYEVDAAGRRLRSRTVKSLQEVTNFSWTQEEREVGGVMATVFRMSAGLSFPHKCILTMADLKPGVQLEQVPANLAFETFVFMTNSSNESASLAYGNETVDVYSGQMKFNIESSAWPFCGDDHALRVRLNVKVPGNKLKPKRFSERGDKDIKELADRLENATKEAANENDNSTASSDPARRLGWLREKAKRAMHRKRMIVGAGDFDFDLDLPEVVLVDNESINCSVNLIASPSRMDVYFTFPAFNGSMVYDPVAGFVDESAEGEVVETKVEDDDLSDGVDSTGGDATTQDNSTTIAAESADVTDLARSMLSQPSAGIAAAALSALTLALAA